MGAVETGNQKVELNTKSKEIPQQKRLFHTHTSLAKSEPAQLDFQELKFRVKSNLT